MNHPNEAARVTYAGNILPGAASAAAARRLMADDREQAKAALVKQIQAALVSGALSSVCEQPSHPGEVLAAPGLVPSCLMSARAGTS